MCESVHVSTDSHGSQKQVSDPLELELQVVVRHATWVLGNEPGSAGKRTSTLECGASSLSNLFAWYSLGYV